MKLSEVVLSLLVAICLSLSSFQLYWTFNTNAKIEVLSQKVEQILNNKETDTKQNITLIKHWKLNSWAKDEINKIRYKLGLELVCWPALDD